MEALPRRAYNRRLWRQAAAGMGWKAHLFSAAVALAAGAIRPLTSGTLESEWPLNIGLALAAGTFIELALLGFRRFVAAPHEFYEKQTQQNVERDAEVEALRKQVRKLPRPRLVLTYAVESLKGFEDEVSNPPILLHNEGDAAAVEAHVEALQLSPLVKVTFSTVQRIGAQDTAVIVPRVEIRTEGGGWELDHNEKHFGLAIQRAHVELAHRNVKTQHGSRHWTMTVRYHDAGGASYTQDHDLTLHVPTMTAGTAFMPPVESRSKQ
ncbi:MAG: hypothetical protein EHM55_15645 [Acidobacteria bacterium]|nr:MAG: hypothetical protein EHM55_15645 [Acidobacteriota bacterium]